MALTNTNAMDRKGGDTIATSYIRLINAKLSDDGTKASASIKAYIDEAAYNANPGNDIPLAFNNYAEFDYDRATDGEDFLLFLNEQWQAKLYEMFPAWSGTGLTIVNVSAV